MRAQMKDKIYWYDVSSKTSAILAFTFECLVAYIRLLIRL
jgi:hypothetical protein